ncbi:flagellar basal body rod protein FlgG [Paenibacillus selenitireducens]|uniref:Flagellar hook protein FlgE n=1 Tax=Paenibacillus selenitireducens TaxID=1324314 RepID=A0A1T2XCH7_9BACL|nr:flagellar basal body rod protein FlgG [Paenibacillus selenitireducens]OPA77599.1 flagellar basal body rod protein FlgG [Paenibacillus selenitireducens]
MLRSMYSGVSGMRGFQTKLDVIGNNIANVNTVGFKAGRVMFKDIMSQTVGGATAPADGKGGVNPKQIGLGVTVGSVDTIHLGGSAMTTNQPLDLRIDGDGFFAVKLTEDQEQSFLTRAGDFHIDAERNIVTSDGMRVVGEGGGVLEPLEDTVVGLTIAQDGTLMFSNADGSVSAGPKIGVVKVVNPEGLEKLGGNLYRVTANATLDGEFEVVGANDAALGTGAIVAGQLEMSNVELTGEFTEMIVAQRGFQANSRIITTSDEVLQEVVNLKR